MLKRSCHLLIIFEVILGIAHLLWPEYRWGQGRHSYFNLGNSLTLASWCASVQLVCVAILSLACFHSERRNNGAQLPRTAWVWLAGAAVAIILSVAEITRFHLRLKLFGYPNPDIYQEFVIFVIWLCIFGLFGWFLLHRVRSTGLYKYSIGWLVAWGIKLFFTIHSDSSNLIPHNWHSILALVNGLAYLFGCTMLLLTIGSYVLRLGTNDKPPAAAPDGGWSAPFHERSNRIWIFLGVGGMTFTVIFLQIILFRMLTIFGDYLTASSVISIALLGIAIGGLIGWRTARYAPLQTIMAASLTLPFLILLAFGTTVSFIDTPLLASILLMTPFICAGAVITIALIRTQSHLVYACDLLGAAAGALLVNVALSHFREEGSLFFLAAFTLLLSCCFVRIIPIGRVRIWLFPLVLAGSLSFLAIGWLNLQSDWLNIVKPKILHGYPQAEVLFSRSSFVGRYDVIRKTPAHKSLSTLDNGRVIDTIRRRPAEEYLIDPRIPHNLIKDPVILILGLSGDGISKTSKALGRDVYGVEINPAVVNLQRNELVKYNSNSYDNIKTYVMDGRSFVEQSDQRFDIVTLMNAHSARGRMAGRAPSPEYLHTLEAMTSYLEHLTERGVIIVEEPVSLPRREPPVWKLLLTMRQSLINQGSLSPENHFFVFQWRTQRNNYIQILMKKSPYTKTDVNNLKSWLRHVDNIREIEGNLGRVMGPIRARTTILYSPDEPYSTNYSSIIRGEADMAFLRGRNMHITTDDRPFHFDVNPAHPALRNSYMRTLIMSLLLIPFLLPFLICRRTTLRNTIPYLLVVALTGMGYLLLEVVLIQRYEIFLGSPVVAFSTILGSLLIFSGIGSIWSGYIGRSWLYISLAAILALLMAHQWLLPSFLLTWTSPPLHLKVVYTAISIAPLGFFMGVPFPYALRTGKAHFSESAAGMLFAVNAATSALAVPLAINISTSFGFNATFQSGITAYIAVSILLISIHKKRLQPFSAGLAVVILGMLLVWPWTFGHDTRDNKDAPPYYKVYAVSYGKSFRREDKVIQGGSPSAFMPFEWYFWVIRGDKRTILVDTGFGDPAMAKRWGVLNYVQPVHRLQQLDISPSDISDIILTHAHWDHLGNLAPYKEANIWMQADEYEYARSKEMHWRGLENLTLANEEGRLHLIDGDRELRPGIRVTLDGSHTPGHQYVTVDALDGNIIIGGDATCMYQNNRRHKPIADAVDHNDNLAAIREMHGIAASPFFILPGHDPLVTRWFPEVSEGIVQITSVPE